MKRKERNAPPRLSEDHTDYATLTLLESAILRHAGGWDKFRRDIPKLLRQAIDEVIDAPRSKRFTVEQLKPVETKYIQNKVKILLRNYLGVERGGVMDLLIDGMDVDVKSTIRSTWIIPNGALKRVCILISANEETALCSFGLIVIRPELLNEGRNRDQEITFEQNQLHNAIWMLFDAPYPRNFWHHLSAEDRLAVMAPWGGTERLARLFELYQRRPISRLLVRSLARQDDCGTGLRKNRWIVNSLAEQGIAVLESRAHRKLIEDLGLPRPAARTFFSVTPTDNRELALLKASGVL